jgi:hypothetical protein
MRARWLAARRSEGRRRLRAVGALGLIAVLGAACLGVLESPLLSVAHVSLRGARHESVAQVRAVAGLTRGRHMISVDPPAAARRLETLPWVASATVSRHWPDSVAVVIDERVAVAQVAVAPASRSAPSPVAGAGPTAVPGRMGLVDATGRVLSWVSTAVPGLPTLVGGGTAGVPGTWLSGAGSGPGRAGFPPEAPASGVPALLAVVALLPAPVASDVHRLDDAGGVLSALVGVSGSTTTTPGVASAPGGPSVTVILGDTSQLADKVVALQSILAQVDLTQVGAIDLRVPARPALTGTPRPG